VVEREGVEEEEATKEEEEEEIEEDGEEEEEEDSSCSPESSGRTGRRLARLDGVVGLLLLRLRATRWRFNGDRKL
jgi:hypothetical protein